MRARKIVEFVIIYEWKTTFETQPSHDFVCKFDEVTKIYWRQWPRIVLKNDVLYREFVTTDGLHEYSQLIPPVEYRLKILRQAYSGVTGGHLNAKKMKEQVQRRAF